jgi:tetratricopeptide (TPR) repeat protein
MSDAHQADIAWQYAKKLDCMKDALELATKAKDEGNKCYKAQNFDRAVAFYRTGLSKLRAAKDRRFPDALAKADIIAALEVSLLVNTAMCLVKALQWEEAITACGQALRLEPANAKALLFRFVAVLSFVRFDGFTSTMSPFLFVTFVRCILSLVGRSFTIS